MIVMTHTGGNGSMLPVDLDQLRNLLRPHIVALKDTGTHATLPQICAELGLPAPAPDGYKGTKMAASFEEVKDADLPRLAERFLEIRQPAASARNEIQDVLWADSPFTIPKRFRREVARALEREEHYLNARGFDRLLNRLWILGDDLWESFGVTDYSLRTLIEKHVHRNPQDWSAEYLFDQLGAFDASDKRFALFIEGLASADVRPDEAVQRRFVELVNGPLRACGVELRETDIEGGYPVFNIVSLREGSAGRVKNIIFASSEKPDLRFRDAVSNDVEIVTNADKVLVYDRPIPIEGLRWRDLQQWWSETQGIKNDDAAKEALYRRLRESLPDNSPPQTALFKGFYSAFPGSIPDLPALLPEVWLHWDPKTVAQRGQDALLRFRMDFLLLLPYGTRVVIEVDGMHHYASGERANPERYANIMAADRDLKLAGYHVFRFGASELMPTSNPDTAKAFFAALFKRFGVL